MTYLKGLTSIAALIAASPALAQTASDGAQDVVVLEQWSYDPLYADGWSVQEMFDETEVVDASGEEIGDVENLIFSDDGRLLAVIAQVGGFWDIGDTHVSIAWDEVTIANDGETMTVPVTEETIDDYASFDGANAFDWFGSETVFAAADADGVEVVDDDLEAGPQVFKATDLVNDMVYLDEEVRYGYVSDILVTGDTISAILVDAAGYGMRGDYAYPYYGYGGYSPYGARYNLPYAEEEIKTIGEFDYDLLGTSEAG